MSHETRAALLDLSAHLVALLVGVPFGAAIGFVITFGPAWITAPEKLLVWIFISLPLGIVAGIACVVLITGKLGRYLSLRFSRHLTQDA
jgi:ABC-type amino acid transport system permease subunit